MAFNIYTSFSLLVNFIVSQTSVWIILIVLITIGLIKVLQLIKKYARRRAEYTRLLPGNKYPWYDFVGDFRQLLSSDLLKQGKTFHSALSQLYLDNIKKFARNKLVCYWASYVPVVLAWNAEAAEVILQDKEIEGRAILYQYFKPLFGTGLITSDYFKWKPRRKLLAPCFHADILKTFMPVFNEQAQTLSQHFRNKSNGDFIYTGLPITLCTTEILLQTVLGVKLDVQANSGEQYVKSVRSLTKLLVGRMTNFWCWPDCIFNRTKQGKETNFHMNYISEFTRSVIAEKKTNLLSQQLGDNNTKRKALLDHLLELHLQTKELSEEDIKEEVETFAAAGHGTTSASISWALYNIGLHKDIQEKIHAELDRVFGNDDERPVGIDDMNDLKYLNCVLKETKRMYPPVPVIPKKNGEDLDVCGYRVPKGTICFILVYAVHRDEEVFPNPEKFDPDRFLPENTADLHPYAYIPFSVGPRNCIGSKYASMEEIVIVSTVLRHFTIEAIDQRDQVPLIDMTLRPAIPIRIKFTPRR